MHRHLAATYVTIFTGQQPMSKRLLTMVSTLAHVVYSSQANLILLD